MGHGTPFTVGGFANISCSFDMDLLDFSLNSVEQTGQDGVLLMTSKKLRKHWPHSKWLHPVFIGWSTMHLHMGIPEFFKLMRLTNLTGLRGIRPCIVVQRGTWSGILVTLSSACVCFGLPRFFVAFLGLPFYCWWICCTYHSLLCVHSIVVLVLSSCNLSPHFPAFHVVCMPCSSGYKSVLDGHLVCPDVDQERTHQTICVLGHSYVTLCLLNLPPHILQQCWVQL